jgi:hypothetical protein
MSKDTPKLDQTRALGARKFEAALKKKAELAQKPFVPRDRPPGLDEIRPPAKSEKKAEAIVGARKADIVRKPASPPKPRSKIAGLREAVAAKADRIRQASREGKKVVTLYLDPDLAKALKLHAVRNETTVEAAATEAIAKLVKGGKA